MNNISRRRFVNLVGLGGLGAAVPAASWGDTGVPTAPVFDASIEVDLNRVTGRVSPNIHGQFIEYLGRAIDGGIFEEGSALSNAKGFRNDVLKKLQTLRPTLLRYPGGTVTKIYHWEDGVGPVKDRPARPNLIWGGINTNHFGTDEFVEYCRLIGAAPYMTVNMGSGTAEEAADWVEYCNGAEHTRYSDQRRKNGYAEPFKVKYWGLGNEENATQDAGRLQDVTEYSKEAWLYAKLMKLQDPSLQLVASGADDAWNEYVLREMHPVCDYISIHFSAYAETGKPQSLFANVDKLENQIETLKRKIKSLTPDKVTDFHPFYRFPPRQQPVLIAIDELGIWRPGGAGAYELELVYDWNDALATATFYNILLRHADIVGMAAWAQTVNVLAPLLTSKTASVAQSIFYPMVFYRNHSGDLSISADVKTPALQLPGAEDRPALDVSATLESKDGSLALLVVNRHPLSGVRASLSGFSDRKFSSVVAYELNASGVDAQNTIERPEKNVVVEKERKLAARIADYIFPAHSITALVFRR